ncbi:MFS transporter [Neobacillus niacini]|uniref:MFS transporter n=1 Tax=Neobacillus niacini TaxID=86668 RepID=UPI003000B85F
MDVQPNIRHWLLVVGVCLVMLTTSTTSNALGFFIDPVTKELGYTRTVFSIYSSLIAFIGMVSYPVIGKTFNKIGARKIIIGYGIMGTSALLGFSYSTSLFSFYFWGAFFGLAAPVSMLATAILVNTWFIDKKGTIMGIATACSGLGGGIFSIILPLIIESEGWRIGYLSLALTLFVCTIPVAIFLIKNNPQSVGLKPYGAVKPRNSPEIEDHSHSEEKTSIPYAQALKSPTFYILYCGILLLSICTSFILHLPAYFVGEGLSALTAGGLMTIYMIAMIIAMILTGLLDDKIGTKNTLTLIYGLYILSFILLANSSLYGMFVVVLVMMAFGQGSLSVLPALLTSKIFGPKDYSGIFGIVATAMALGFSIGALMWSLMFDKSGSYNLGIFGACVIIPFIFISFLLALKTGNLVRTSSNTAFSMDGNENKALDGK